MTEPDHTTESVPTTATTASTETTALPTRDRLVLAMSESLRTRGYGSTSMKDLLAGAGISSGSMYHSFPGGKEQLAAEAVRRVGFDGASRIRWVFDDAEDAATAVRRIFAALAREDLQLRRLVLGQALGFPARFVVAGVVLAQLEVDGFALVLAGAIGCVDAEVAHPRRPRARSGRGAEW